MKVDFGGGDEIAFERIGKAGVVTLTRTKALNALTHGMVKALAVALTQWADESDVAVVVVKAEGRAFSAGGDILDVYRRGKAGEHPVGFFADEYRLNAQIQCYPKPYISLIDGIVMGGGVGISFHGSHRIISENALFAMPEVGIGFFPDVGMTYTLPRLPGRTGTYLALTGATIGAGDALALGLATHCVRADAFDSIVAALGEGEGIDAVLDRYADAAPPTGPMVAERDLIDACFAEPSVSDILARLDGAAAQGAAFAADTAALLRSRSPTSLCIAHAQMWRGLTLSFAECIAAETRLAAFLMHGHDFFEGVRAALIDKDGAPAWQPASLDAVDHAAIAHAFAPTGGPAPRSEP